MKRITILLMLIFGFTKAQFFESNQEEYPQEDSHFFKSTAPTPPEQSGNDWGDIENPTNPGNDPVPLDDWLFLLPLAGIAVGTYYLNKIQKAKA